MCDRFLLLLAQNTKHYELLNYSEHGTTVDNVLYSCDFSEKMAPTPPSSIVAKVQSVISECPPSPALSCHGDPWEVLFPSAQLPLAWLLRRMCPCSPWGRRDTSWGCPGTLPSAAEVPPGWRVCSWSTPAAAPMG